MKSGLVSIAIRVASGAMRRRQCSVKVPTPGPYSTNNLQLAQSTGASILSIVARDEGMMEPTITGGLMKPRRKCQRGLPLPLRAKRPFVRASSQDDDMIVPDVRGKPERCQLGAGKARRMRLRGGAPGRPARGKKAASGPVTGGSGSAA